MERIVIVTACDDKYAQYCGVLITSIFDNNKENNVIVNILTDYISDENRNLMQQLERMYGRNINIINIDKELFSALPLPSHAPQINICTYYRLLIPTLFPTEERVLYLDCDMIVRKNLMELWKTDLKGYAFAGVRDCYQMQRACIRLNYTLDEYYYNAGMGLYNLNYLREIGFDKIVKTFIHEHYDLIICHDQDILNACFHGQFKSVSVRWNLLDVFIRRDYKYPYDDKDDFISSCKDGAIIHYSGPCSKPWFKDTLHPYVKDFLHYYEISPWNFEMKYRLPIIKRIKTYIMYCFYELFGLFGLKYGDVSPIR